MTVDEAHGCVKTESVDSDQPLNDGSTGLHDKLPKTSRQEIRPLASARLALDAVRKEEDEIFDLCADPKQIKVTEEREILVRKAEVAAVEVTVNDCTRS